jgi:hypothetical protein
MIIKGDETMTDEPEKTEEASPKPEESGSENTPSAAPIVEEVVTEKEVAPSENQEENKETKAEEFSQENIKEDGEKKSSPVKKIIFITLIIVLFGGIIGGGIFVYHKAMKKSGAETKPSLPTSGLTSPTPIEEADQPAPTATPSPQLERGDLKVQVLNGGGIAGLAGKVKELLENLGYQEVKTGNAASYDYEETEVSVKEEKEAYLKLLVDDLSEDYSVGTKSSDLKESSQFDAVVIVGKK